VNKLERGYPIRLYQHMVWGRAEPTRVQPLDGLVPTRHGVLEPINTPGHSKDHTVFLDRRNGCLFAGDLFIGERIKFFRSDERMEAQISSLKTVLALDFDALLCGHNPVARRAKGPLGRKLAFLEEFRGKVRRMKDSGLSERRVIRALDRGHDRLIKWITMGNASFANMVRSAYHGDPS
jgi:glyoxylase-like metal-dependent hydrolase (beta-lactamase superfamily II)